MSKEETIQWIIDHLFDGTDCSNQNVQNLFMKMDDSEIQEFVRVVDLYYSDLMVEGDLTPIKKILLKYDHGNKLIGFCLTDAGEPEEGQNMIFIN